MESSSKVGIRELRQNLSVYLRRLQAGERFEVTDRGRAVALLLPLPASESALDRLIASGRATAPQGDLLDLGLPREAAPTPLSEALGEARRERL